MSKPRPKSFGNLIVEVIRTGRCTFCGACVAACPEDVLELQTEAPTIKGKCTVCQTCYFSCPQTSLDLETVERKVFGRKRKEEEKLGIMLEACFARTLDPEISTVGQDGGAVTAILENIIQEKSASCAVVSTCDRDLPWKPFPNVATDRESIVLGAGTKYTPSPTLIGLVKAAQDFKGKQVAVVGTPCQVKAIRKIQTSSEISSEIIPEDLLTVGLFCMESYSYESLIGEFLPSKAVDPTEVTKFAIKKGRFLVYSNGEERINVPLKEVKTHVRKACHSCRDFTAELADLSVGSVDAPPGWSTLVLRNQKALDAVQDAEKSGRLEVRKIPNPKETLRVTQRLSERKNQQPEKNSS
ncbi:MAG: Coenzyme F420 hydrogenase/dehydrogenase, beta subunit C-terminal domain [Candidatus Bathyarchaeota archaeon]|nr:MAG: Coenzyme F420 hydrogenase/dehydrogenase, beta subunit C-terminal domain [Candidatus Bathyarchaeota archaeon]